LTDACRSRPPRGHSAEEAAVRYVERLGWRVLARNFRTRLGEIDIVARDGATTVFLEVKARSRSSHGRASNFTTVAKQLRIVAAARVYAARSGLSESALRFDVLAYDGEDALERPPRHDRGAFDAGH
jgi:putative endonuclease